MAGPPFVRSKNRPNTLTACGLEKHMQLPLIFVRIIRFVLFTVLLLLMYFVWKNFLFTFHVNS
jgi:hypothetical protein